jgi:nucleoside-diphosphate-sugar epimerase
MKYFVTGATGFIGQRLVKQLRQGGHEVVAVVRDPGRVRDLEATLVKGDVTDVDSLRTGMEGCDGVFHLAGWYKIGVKDKRPGRAINIDGTRNVCQAMLDAKVPKGVYTSTVAVFSDTHGEVPDERYHFTGRHISEYDRTKAEAHDIAAEFISRGLPLVIVQPGLVYGPDDQSAIGQAFRKYLRRQLPLLPGGCEYCWAFVDDIARAHILAMEKGAVGETYIVCGPRHSLVEAMGMARKITGIAPPRLTAPPWLMRALSSVMAVVEKVVPVPEDYSSEYLRVSAGVTYLGDNAKARRELGYAPRPLEEGLAETLLCERHKLGV